MDFQPAPDCRHYRGDRPCRFACTCRCEHYEAMGTRVLIVKLAALGDVVRTACLLPTLKRQFHPCHVTWITRPGGVRILRGHPLIDRFLTYNAEGILLATQQEFDLVICLDKEPGPAGLCSATKCPDRRGISLSAFGTVQPANPQAGYYVRLGLDDDLKFRVNTLTYPELIHQAVGLPYRREAYRLYPEEACLRRAQELLSTWRGGANAPVVGLNTGSGRTFANKAPRTAGWLSIGRRLLEKGYTLVLLGGRQQQGDNAWLAGQLGPGAHLADTDHTEQQFVALIDQCDALVSGDTLAMHVAIARDVPVVALFGPTCPQEIDLFDRGVKIVSPIDCAPCYRSECDKDPNCMDLIDPGRIVQAVDQLLGKTSPQTGKR